MESSKRISELLVETKAFRDLEKPVILASGELGIYYINTEKLVQDNGEFEKYGDDSRKMIEHAIKMMYKKPKFKEVIHLMIDKMIPALNEAGRLSKVRDSFISGGQRRDWLFSGPISEILGAWHVSLYKDGKIEVFGRYLNPLGPVIKNLAGVHVVDLLTEGSSVYRKENEQEKGWLPMIRQNNATVNNLFAIVTRKQGAEERLKEQNLNVTSLAAIDKDFIENCSKMPERDLEYIADPNKWSQDYIEKNGALEFLDDFNPESKKFDRAKRFLKRYEKILISSDKYYDLDKAVMEKYNKSLSAIIL